MEVVKSIVYTDLNSYESLVKDHDTLYIVKETEDSVRLYFRSMKLENIVDTEELPEELLVDCFYIVKDCLYYSDGIVAIKLFDSKVVDIVKSGEEVKFILSNGEELVAVVLGANNEIYPSSVRDQIISSVGVIDLAPEWEVWEQKNDI